jgi:hypothetical protein
LKTLSRSSYEPPPPTAFVLIDYADTATFDAFSGYYHPAMKTVDGRIISSSDRLLHDFLKRSSWESVAVDELTLLRKVSSRDAQDIVNGHPIATFGSQTKLLSIKLSAAVLSNRQPLQIQTDWRFDGERDVFPWMFLRLTRPQYDPVTISRGLCAPEVSGTSHREIWSVQNTTRLEEGNYTAEAIFVDNTKRSMPSRAGGTQPAPPTTTIPLGQIRILKH